MAIQSVAAWLRTAPTGLSAARAGLRGIAWAAVAVVVDQLLGAWLGVCRGDRRGNRARWPLVSLLGAAGVALRS